MPDIQHSIPIAASVEAVYPLIATGRGFAKWWTADVTEPPGRVELGFFKRSVVYSLELMGQTPPTYAEWLCTSHDEWAGTKLIFRLSTTADGSVLRFTHADWKAATDYFTGCNTTWGELMFRLKSAAEGKPRGPLFLADGFAS